MKNRVIKFRGWDGKSMFDVAQITLNDATWHVDKGRGVSIQYQPHVTIMQFTGQLSCNKIEIFEGDVVKVELPMGGFWGNVKQEKLGVVQYDTDEGAYIVKWGYSKNQHHVILNRDIALTADIWGNIYENPELQTRFA